MTRTAADESARLHRARRAAEIAERDAALCAADRALQACREALAESLLALTRWRPQEALTRLMEAIHAVDRARLVLREYFDKYRSKDDGY